MSSYLFIQVTFRFISMIDWYFVPTGSRLLRTCSDLHVSVELNWVASQHMFSNWQLGWVELGWVGRPASINTLDHTSPSRDLFNIHRRKFCKLCRTWWRQMEVNLMELYCSSSRRQQRYNSRSWSLLHIWAGEMNEYHHLIYSIMMNYCLYPH